jgi:nicotinate phosphoribosyltransferase
MNPLESALFTDFYQLTMLSGYYHQKKADQRAVYELFFRKIPNQGGFCVSAGLHQALDYLQNVRVSEAEITYLRDLGTFDESFLQWLKGFRFRGTVKAMAEGTLVFANEPILQVHATLPEAQLVESALLNVINFQTLIATKAARVCHSATRVLGGTYQGLGEVLEFGMRRAQGPNGAMMASRAAFVGGCGATSNALAGLEYGIPVRGTQAHAWVMSFATEIEAFRAYAASYPKGTLLLVDTYDTLSSGVPNAIKVGLELKERGEKLVGIRLDSGDLALLSREARRMLDEAGLTDAKIVASNDLDEVIIQSLRLEGACIDIWGVGTQLVTSKSEPALGGVYKLVAIQEGEDFRPTLKVSSNPGKVTNPAAKQIWRGSDAKGHLVEDRLCLADEAAPSTSRGVAEWKPLLETVIQDGKLVSAPPSLVEIQSFVKSQLAILDSATQRFSNPTPFPVNLSTRLSGLKQQLLEAASSAKQ